MQRAPDPWVLNSKRLQYLSTNDHNKRHYRRIGVPKAKWKESLAQSPKDDTRATWKTETSNTSDARQHGCSMRRQFERSKVLEFE